MKRQRRNKSEKPQKLGKMAYAHRKVPKDVLVSSTRVMRCREGQLHRI